MTNVKDFNLFLFEPSPSQKYDHGYWPNIKIATYINCLFSAKKVTKKISYRYLMKAQEFNSEFIKKQKQNKNCEYCRPGHSLTVTH